MPKRPNVAAELSAKMTRALEARRAQGGAAYPTTLGLLRQEADPAAAPELTFKAVGKPPFSERAVVAKKKSLAAPVALREDLELLAASRAVLEFALEALSASGPSPWPLKKVSGQIDKGLRAPFEAAVARQLAEDTLPESVAAITVRGKPALYLKRQPPPKPPEVELAERLVRALEAQGRLGPESYPARLSRLVELTGLAATPKVLKKARALEPFAGRVVVLVPKDTDPPLALTDDLERVAAHPCLLTSLLEAARTGSAQAFTVTDLKARLAKPVQGPFADSVRRQMETASLPAGVGWIGAKRDRLLFRLEDVRAPRPPASASPVPRPTPAVPADFGAAFDEAFARLDRQAGSHNFVSLVDLRRALSFDRATFDAHLGRLRAAGRYTLSAAEGRHGITEEQRAAGIAEEGSLLLFASRR
ncbi:MAG TPA: hypothetical protein VKA46_18545 [Gemmataceae bacterium]|nr:hypothetical protein [Gemmataceae bacterium]